MLRANLRTTGRKRTTLETYESAIRVQLAPYFGEQRLDRIGRHEIEGFIRALSGPSTVSAGLPLLSVCAPRR